MTRDFQYLVAMVDPDSIGMKRHWRMMKLEWAQLKAHSNGVEAEAGLQLCFRFYNTRQPHQDWEGLTTAEVSSGHSLPADEGSQDR